MRSLFVSLFEREERVQESNEIEKMKKKRGSGVKELKVEKVLIVIQKRKRELVKTLSKVK